MPRNSDWKSSIILRLMFLFTAIATPSFSSPVLLLWYMLYEYIFIRSVYFRPWLLIRLMSRSNILYVLESSLALSLLQWRTLSCMIQSRVIPVFLFNALFWSVSCLLTLSMSSYFINVSPLLYHTRYYFNVSLSKMFQDLHVLLWRVVCRIAIPIFCLFLFVFHLQLPCGYFVGIFWRHMRTVGGQVLMVLMVFHPGVFLLCAQ